MSKELIEAGALRQFCHNNGDPGYVIAYDKEITDRVFAANFADATTAGWQPIETAPKTGRTLLLGCFNERGNWRTMRGQWYSREAIDQEWEDPDQGEEGWYETAVEPDVPNCWAIAPTHWMPLPSPPDQSQPAGAARQGGNTCDKAACAIDALDGLGYRYDSEIGWLPPAAVVRAPADLIALIEQAQYIAPSLATSTYELTPIQIGWIVGKFIAAEGATPAGEQKEAQWEGLTDLFGVIAAKHGVNDIQVNGGAADELFPRVLAEFIVAASRSNDEDGARFRWLNEDHDDAEVRDLARSLAKRLGTSSYFAITRDIDEAMARIDGDKHGEQGEKA